MTNALEVGGVPVELLDLPGTVPGAPLVLLHEGLGSVGLWREFPAQLQVATDRRVIAFSRYGHGRSGPPPASRTPAFFHEEALQVLPELLGALDVAAPVLVGHSDGASIGLIHAADHPVSALVLLAPHVFLEGMTVRAIRGTRDLYVNGELRRRMSRHHDDPDAAFWGWCDVWLDPAFGGWSLDAEVRRLAAPTLLIQGTEDPYGSLAQIDRIEAGAAGPVQRLVLPGGHSPHLDHGREVADAVAAFLRSLAA
ncbi:MAG: alpha/beta fold hydrolase [Solirubrobacteraceae bacterium]